MQHIPFLPLEVGRVLLTSEDCVVGCVFCGIDSLSEAHISA